MEQNTNQNSCEVCKGHMGNCSGKYHHQYGLLRWVLVIVVVYMIFSLGMKVGEFKGMLGGEYGGGSYRHGYGKMMRGGQWDVVTPTATAQPAPAVLKN